jgi:uncharacterized protein (TIGR02099 family)
MPRTGTMLKIFQRSSLQIGRILFLVGLTLSIAAAAALVTLRYWILPDIEKHHDEVTALASRAVGLQVKIGKIEADLYWFRPHLVFTDVQLLDEEGHSVLELRRIDNVVSWMTLLSGELRLQALEVDDPDLLVRRDKQGVLHVAGLQVSGRSTDGKLSDWLLHQSRIIISNGRVTWQDDLYDRPALVFNQFQLRLDNSGKHHRFAVRVSPPASVADPLDARGDLVGDSFSDWSDWHGELFAQINRADSETWGTWINLPEEFSHAKGDARTWIGIEGGRVNRVTADLDVSKVKSRLAADLPQLNLTELSGRIGWHELEHGFEVSTKKLALQLDNGFSLQPTDFHLRLSGNKENPFAAGEIQANAIELADLSVMSKYIPLGKAFKQKLTDFSPQGHISDLRSQWQESDRFDIKARFDKLSMQRVGKLPGVEGLSGEVSGNESSGVLSLNAPHLKVDAPQFLLGPVSFDTFSAQTGWQRKRDGWDIKLNNFTFANEDLVGTAYGNYQTDANGPGTADVSMNLTHTFVPNVVKYLPKELVGKATMTWMQTSLLGGEADEAHFRLRGDLNDFPFPGNKKGLFQFELKGRGIVIDYSKDWPRVENALGTVLIEGQRIDVDSSYAMSAGVRVQKAHVSIPDFMGAEPVVKIQGETTAETQHILNFVKHSPIRGFTNKFTDNTTAVGDGKLEVKMEIPLTDKPTKLNGNYHFIDNEIKIDEFIPLARKVTGDFSFTESTVQAKGITAEIFGGPVVMSGQTESNGAIKGKLQGKINAEVWRTLDPSLWVQSLSGGADWNSEVFVQGKQFDVQVSTNLQGLSSSLPAPLLKSAHEAIPLKYEYKSVSASQDVMTVQYGNIVNARALRADDKMGTRSIKRGIIDFGPAHRIGEKEGIWVTGTLPLLSVEGWPDTWPIESKDGKPMPVIDGWDVTVQKAVGYGSTINGLNIHSRNHAGAITTQLVSKDLSGEVNWFPQGKGKVVARLRNAVLGDEEKANKAETAHTVLPRDKGKSGLNFSIPVIDIAVEHFTYQGKQLGRLELHASQVEKDILLDQLHLVNPDGTLTVNGKWGLSPSQTHMVAKLELYDSGKMLNRSGYPNTLKDGNGTLDCDLTWPGAPKEMKLANLDGHLNLKMSKGQFLKVDPGAGKLLSVLNLQSLPKRITLDFNDVFSKGFEFDDIIGVAQLRQGVLMTNDFKINGSAAQVTMSGQVDLTRETQSLRVRVLPAIGNSVSLLAFAAGPAVGAGVFLANKIFRDPLDKLVSFEYNVTGSWVDPQVEKAGQVKATTHNSNN